MNPPFVSIIIPVLEDYESLEKCLEALEEQSYGRENYEIVVVDNGSAAQYVRDLNDRAERVRWYCEPQGGSYAARNCGIEHACGEVLAFTDADCIPARDWLERGVEAIMSDDAIGLLAGAIQVFADDPASPTPIELYEMKAAFPQQYFVEKLSFGATANVFTRRDVFDSVGLFDASLRSGGDREWGQRVKRSGYQLAFRNDVVVRHPTRRSLEKFHAKMMRIARGLHEIYFASEPSRLKRALWVAQVLRECLPPVRFSARVVCDNEWSSREKAALVWMHLYYVYGMGAERIKLLLREVL
jgi:glycosyltransferase involved in cell wall biosynthesis